MFSSNFLKFVSLSVLVYRTQALVTNLEIGNANIAPDGYNRKSVFFPFLKTQAKLCTVSLSLAVSFPEYFSLAIWYENMKLK